MELDDTGEGSGPPANADDWTNEQWIDWLKATDAAADAERGLPPATISGRIVHSSGGQMLGLTMMGVARAIYGQRNDRPVIVREANSEPEKDQSVIVHLDHDHPEQSYAIVRSESEH